MTLRPWRPIGSLNDTPIPALLLVQQATTLPPCWSRLLFLPRQRHWVGTEDELLKCISVNNSQQIISGQMRVVLILLPYRRPNRKSLYCYWDFCDGHPVSPPR